MTEQCRVSEEELQHDCVTAQDNHEENQAHERKKQAMNEHIDFIMSTDKNYILEAVVESDDASDALLALCTTDINKHDMSKSENLRNIGRLAVRLNAAIEAYIRDCETLKHGE